MDYKCMLLVNRWDLEWNYVNLPPCSPNIWSDGERCGSDRCGLVRTFIIVIKSDGPMPDGSQPV